MGKNKEFVDREEVTIQMLKEFPKDLIELVKLFFKEIIGYLKYMWNGFEHKEKGGRNSSHS